MQIYFQLSLERRASSKTFSYPSCRRYQILVFIYLKTKFLLQFTDNYF